MNCLQIEEYFSSHFEDTLDFQTLQKFEKHISNCEACQKEYELFRESVTELRQLPQDQPSPHFLATIQQQLIQEQPARLSFLQRMYSQFVTPKWALSGGLVMLIAIIGLFLYQFNVGNDDNAQLETLTQSTQMEEDKSSSVIVEDSRHTTNSPTLRNNFVSGKPMQRRYVLKQVSYSTLVTGGGL